MANYRKWVRDIEELQSVKFDYALLSDTDCSVLKAVSEDMSTSAIEI